MDIPQISAALKTGGYIPDDSLSTLLWMGLALQRPMLLEGEAGVGKTSVAAAMARVLQRPLIRLQCHEGMDLNQAVYEWNVSRQLLEIRIREAQGALDGLQDDLFSEDFLLARPLLQALRAKEPVVLLIDEIDRADEAFEAFLLEALAEYQVTVPELGTLKAHSIPLVILSSNGTRDLSDALRRRCLYHYIDFPNRARETDIVRAAVPEADVHLVEEAVSFIHGLRKEDLDKKPGVAETLDWVRVLHKLDLKSLPDDETMLQNSLFAILKTRADQWQMTPERLRKAMGRRAPGVDAGIVPSAG